MYEQSSIVPEDRDTSQSVGCFIVGVGVLIFWTGLLVILGLGWLLFTPNVFNAVLFHYF